VINKKRAIAEIADFGGIFVNERRCGGAVRQKWLGIICLVGWLKGGFAVI
jgi:hypothetical protein